MLKQLTSSDEICIVRGPVICVVVFWVLEHQTSGVLDASCGSSQLHDSEALHQDSQEETVMVA